MPKPASVRRLLIASLAGAGAFMTAASQSAQAEPDVIASITPLHSLVAGVMDGVAEPYLLVGGGESPHTYSLKPSEAARLERADLVVWIGPDLESFLQRPLQSLAREDSILRIQDVEAVDFLDARHGGSWEAHADDHAEHGHGGHDEHGHVDHGHDEEGHDEERSTDMHIWLDPDNAKAIVEAVAERLSGIDPANAETYAANAEEVQTRIEALDEELVEMLEPVADRPYIVFHDAYQYFERHYALNAVGSITVSPERQPGARRLNDMRNRIVEDGAVCVFREPQFAPALVQTVIEGTPARSGVLDPLGAALEPGPDAYPQLLRTMAQSLKACLSEAG